MPLPRLTPAELEGQTCPEGEIGEIIVSGPHVLQRYFNNPAAFKANKIIVDETIWHRTGDSGFMREKELYLTGRANQLITVDGKLISPFVIENQLQAIAGISMGTLLHAENKLILVLELTLNSTEVVLNIPSTIFYDEVVYIKIPRDPRHYSKIDYARLKKIIAARSI